MSGVTSWPAKGILLLQFAALKPGTERTEEELLGHRFAESVRLLLKDQEEERTSLRAKMILKAFDTLAFYDPYSRRKAWWRLRKAGNEMARWPGEGVSLPIDFPVVPRQPSLGATDAESTVARNPLKPVSERPRHPGCGSGRRDAPPLYGITQQ
ncbi:hypothetical protein Bbelb_093500 [Branchiostoma belcheri]|nr:hypothetical protein Bbelb_093500 [Branchiostoma belcheri]